MTDVTPERPTTAKDGDAPERIEKMDGNEQNDSLEKDTATEPAAGAEEAAPAPTVVKEAAQTPKKVVEADDDDILLSVGVRAFPGRWQEVRATNALFDEMAGSVNLILTDIPGNLSQGQSSGTRSPYDFIENDELEKLFQMSRSLLKPGAFLIIFHDVEDFGVIKSLLNAAKFLVCPHPTITAKDQETIQKTTSVIFQQCSYECYTAATRDLGGLPRTFYPKLDDKSYPYMFLKTSSKRKFNVVTGVPARARKLCRVGTKSPVRPSEKPLVLLRELIDMYCPQDGLVLDPYAGTFSTALACIDSSRRCFAVEADPDCTALAKKRLVVAARARIARDQRQDKMVLGDDSTRETEENFGSDEYEEVIPGDDEGSTRGDEGEARNEGNVTDVPETARGVMRPSVHGGLQQEVVKDGGNPSPIGQSPEGDQATSASATPMPPLELRCQQKECQRPGIPLSSKPGLCSRCKLRMHDLCAFEKPLTEDDDNELVKYCTRKCWILSK